MSFFSLKPQQPFFGSLSKRPTAKELDEFRKKNVMYVDLPADEKAFADKVKSPEIKEQVKNKLEARGFEWSESVYENAVRNTIQTHVNAKTFANMDEQQITTELLNYCYANCQYIGDKFDSDKVQTMTYTLSDDEQTFVDKVKSPEIKEQVKNRLESIGIEWSEGVYEDAVKTTIQTHINAKDFANMDEQQIQRELLNYCYANCRYLGQKFNPALKPGLRKI